MLVKIDYVSCPDPSDVKLQPYYHPMFGLIQLIFIDYGSNRSKAVLPSGQETWINHTDLCKLVASFNPTDEDKFVSGLPFHYYQLNQSHPHRDYVFKRDAVGIVGRNSRLLILWQNIFQVAGDIDRDEYRFIVENDLLHKVIDMDFYPETHEYFIIPEKREEIYIKGIKFEADLLRKELYKQGYRLDQFK